jgi:hypothetical protein
MPERIWQFNGSDAVLQTGGIRATLDGMKPHQGLSGLCVEETVWPAHVMGIATPRLPGGESESRVDLFARQRDLCAVYEDSPACPVRVEVVWRVVETGPPDRSLAAIDFIVLVRTELLEGRPAVTVESRLASIDVRGLAAGAGGSCTLFRHPQAPYSYAEMMHPADFRDDELQLVGEPDSLWRLSHHLFPHSLEKGVILRARLRGVFLPRAEDERVAGDFYQAFAASEPPLEA